MARLASLVGFVAACIMGRMAFAKISLKSDSAAGEEEGEPPAPATPGEEGAVAVEEAKDKTLGQVAMENFDTDKDGKISLQELLDHVHSKPAKQQAAFKGWIQGFKQADKDNDMHLTEEELDVLLANEKKDHKEDYADWLDGYAKKATEAWDEDKDGKISFMELTEHMVKNPTKQMHIGSKKMTENFKDADVDSDLHLDAEELKTFISHMNNKTRRVEKAKKNLAEVTMKSFDKDEDGKISLHELIESIPQGKNHEKIFKEWTASFKRADADGDMHLTVEELHTLLSGEQKTHKDDFEEWLNKYAKTVTEEWDNDKDGKISYMEFTEHMHGNEKLGKGEDFKKISKSFKDADVDNDLHLDATELRAYLTKIGKNARKGKPLHDDL